jgi:hypothetical protein
LSKETLIQRWRFGNSSSSRSPATDAEEWVMDYRDKDHRSTMDALDQFIGITAFILFLLALSAGIFLK